MERHEIARVFRKKRQSAGAGIVKVDRVMCVGGSDLGGNDDVVPSQAKHFGQMLVIGTIVKIEAQAQA